MHLSPSLRTHPWTGPALLLALTLSLSPGLAQAQSSKSPPRKAAPATSPPASSTAAAPATPGGAAAAPVPGMPLFYRSLVALDSVQHRELGLPKEWRDFSYARATNVIPLVVSEVVQALRHYPLLFIKDTGSGAINLVALVGNGDGINQFVDSKGQWQANAYIPAWVRRYPFLMASDAQQQAFVAVDLQAALWAGKTERDPLFDTEGKPTARLQQVIAFQRDYAAAARLTEQLSQKLFEAGVLEEARLSLSASDRSAPLNLGGFMLVNEKKLRELPSAELEKLHAADALGLAYAQIFSVGNLRQLRLPTAASGKP